MAGISEEDIQKVRDASDLVAIVGERVVLKQRGREFWGCCPFHSEKTPSFKVNPLNQTWHCFGCGEGGDLFGFVMKSDDLTFPEAVRALAERAHIDIQESGKPTIPNSQKARLKEICAETADFYHIQLMRGKSKEANAAREYLSGRNLGGSIPKKWKLGFAPGRQALVRHLSAKGFSNQDMVLANVAMFGKDGRLRDRFFNRIMFPICNQAGEYIAFGGRVIGKGEPKYLNSQETPLFHKSRVLFGLDKAKNSMTNTGTAIIVEGYTDVIALHESGISNAVATLGTALTAQHVRLISRYASKRIVYLFDGDAAGQRAADRAVEFIDSSMTPEAGRSRIELAAVTLPDNLDPAEYIGSHSAGELQGLIDKSKPLLAYAIDRRLSKYDLGKPEQRAHALSDALMVLAPIKTSLLAKDYAIRIAGMVRMREDDVLAELAKLPSPRRAEDSNNGSESKTKAQQITSVTTVNQQEKNRLRFERELLALLAANPALAMKHVDALVQTQWHDENNKQLSDVIVDTLADNPNASVGAILTAASSKCPHVAGVLTSARIDSSANIEELATYLVDELSIGDLEESIASLKLQLASMGDTDEESYQLIFQSVVNMQKIVSAKKAEHVLPSGREGF